MKCVYAMPHGYWFMKICRLMKFVILSDTNQFPIFHAIQTDHGNYLQRLPAGDKNLRKYSLSFIKRDKIMQPSDKFQQLKILISPYFCHVNILVIIH